MRVVVGGTFSPLHKGHKALFQRAVHLASGDHIVVGLTSDDMASEQRTREVDGYSERKRILEEYINTLISEHPGTTFEIIEIFEVYNKGITQEREADALVVSEGRTQIAKETNKLRVKNGKAPFEIVVVPYVLAQDGLPIKATRITKCEIDENGKILGTVRVAVGTENEVKLNAVRNVLVEVFPEVEILKTTAASGVSPQPWESDTVTGAKNRARGALEKIPDAHFGVGIEAGLINNVEADKHFDVQFCAILDRGGRITVGHGSGYYYPKKVLDGVKAGATVGKVMSELSGIADIGQKKGAIGYLSNGLLTREGLTEQAVLMAMVPRLTDLYE